MDNKSRKIWLVLFAFITIISISFCNVLASDALVPSQVNFLVFSDLHLDYAKTPYSMQIDPKGYNWDNDLDRWTFADMLQQVNKAITNHTLPSPNFILLLGDIAGYDRSGKFNTYDDEKEVFTQLNHAFPHTPIILTFGNNDSLEKDYGAFYYPEGVSGKHSSYEMAVANHWLDGFLSTGRHCTIFNNSYPCLVDENKTDGYFALRLAPKLKLLAINSVMLAASKHNTSSQVSADKQFNWLKNELRIASWSHDAVLIASHIPIGNNIFDGSIFWRDTAKSPDQTKFFQLLAHYKNNVIGMLSGHTHMEELKVMQDKSHKNIGALIFTAGLSTSHGNSPSLKTFSLSKTNGIWSISNYVTYAFHDVTSNSFKLDKLYDYVGTYCKKEAGCGPHHTLPCLQNVSADIMKRFYSAGNPNYKGNIAYPNYIWVSLPSGI